MKRKAILLIHIFGLAAAVASKARALIGLCGFGAGSSKKLEEGLSN